MAINILPSLGTFNVAEGYATAELAAEMSGSWDEKTYGSKYYLEEGSGGGGAIAEVLKGNNRVSYRGLVGSPTVVVDTNITGCINTDYVIEPAIKWIACDGLATFYKVLSVVNDNLIEVEKLFGGTPGHIHALYTRGYALKSVTIAASNADVQVYGYDSTFTVATPNIVTIPVNIDISGPLYLVGDGTVTTNVPVYDNQWL